MRKVWLMLVALFVFVLVGQIGYLLEGNRQKARELIAGQNKTCQLLKEQNRRISRVWDEILYRLNKAQPLYDEVKKFRAITKEAEILIKQSEQRLKRADDEKDDKILFEKLVAIKEDLEKVAFIHRFLLNVLQTIFVPLFQEPMPETPI